MDRLWAPWRINYVKKSAKKKGCIFCRGIKSKPKGSVILKTRYSLGLLNIYPYNNGHLMVAPRRHIRDIVQLKPVEVIDLFESIKNLKKKLDKILRPEGYNIGINIGEVAGAGIPAHLHIHIVPRWKGDTNFMPAISNSKVISQSLKELYRRLKNAKD